MTVIDNIIMNDLLSLISNASFNATILICIFQYVVDVP
jgi:hypothetical protein